MDHKPYLEEWEKRNKEYKDKKRQQEYSMLNGILFLSFVVPAAFALIVGLPMDFFYWLIIVWVHEAGHGFWGLMGSRLLGAFGGFLNEMLFTLVPALICFKEKGIYLAGCIFIMCVGMSIQFTGWYMQSAENPYGMTSFAGAITGRHGDVTPQSHDWSIIFRELGLIKHSYGIGKFTEEFGHGIAMIFFINSILLAVPVMYGWRPEKLTTFIGYGAIVSAVYFILSGAGKIEIILALILSIPLLWAFITRRKTKPESIEPTLEEKEKPKEAAKKDKIEYVKNFVKSELENKFESDYEMVGDAKVVKGKVSDLGIDDLIELANDLISESKRVVILVSVKKDKAYIVVASSDKKINAREVALEISKKLDGKVSDDAKIGIDSKKFADVDRILEKFSDEKIGISIGKSENVEGILKEFRVQKRNTQIK